MDAETELKLKNWLQSVIGMSGKMWQVPFLLNKNLPFASEVYVDGEKVEYPKETTMFIPRKFEKFTNYNGYICDKRAGAHSIEEARLLKVLIEMQNKYKNPYIRFLWVANVESAMCVVYSDTKKNERLTKLISFDEAEKVIMNN